jgi:hypothetical protein
MRLLDDFRAGDVARHEIRRKLDSLERQVEDFRETMNKQRFGETWHADHQHMALYGERDKEVADDLLLANDAFAQFGGDLLVSRRGFAEQLHVGGGSLRVGGCVNRVCNAHIFPVADLFCQSPSFNVRRNRAKKSKRRTYWYDTSNAKKLQSIRPRSLALLGMAHGIHSQAKSIPALNQDA